MITFEDQTPEEVPCRIDSLADGDDEAQGTDGGLYVRAHCTIGSPGLPVGDQCILCGEFREAPVIVTANSAKYR